MSDRKRSCDAPRCDFPSLEEHYRVKVHRTRGNKGWAVSLEWHSGGWMTQGESGRKYFGEGEQAYAKAIEYAEKRHALMLKQLEGKPVAPVSLPLRATNVP